MNQTLLLRNDFRFFLATIFMPQAYSVLIILLLLLQVTDIVLTILKKPDAQKWEQFFKKPFFLAKICCVIFSITALIRAAFYIINFAWVEDSKVFASPFSTFPPSPLSLFSSLSSFLTSRGILRPSRSIRHYRASLHVRNDDRSHARDLDQDPRGLQGSLLLLLHLPQSNEKVLLDFHSHSFRH